MARYVWEFGKPQYGFQYQNEGEFVRGAPQTVGDGQYKLYDAIAPTKAQVAWQMDDLVLNDFQQAWDDPARLNFGNAWFDIELPMSQAPGAGIVTYSLVRAHFVGTYAAGLLGYRLWLVSAALEIDNNALP